MSDDVSPLAEDLSAGPIGEDLLEEARRAVLEKIIAVVPSVGLGASSSAASANEVKFLAEAYAWLSTPHLPHSR